MLLKLNNRLLQISPCFTTECFTTETDRLVCLVTNYKLIIYLKGLLNYNLMLKGFQYKLLQQPFNFFPEIIVPYRSSFFVESKCEL